MRRRKSISEFRRTQIIISHCEELSEQKMTIKIKITKTAAHQAIKKFQLHCSCKGLKKTERLAFETAT